MGGRSRKQSEDRWDWVSELSDSRLDNYGKMSIASFKNNEHSGHDNRASLNYWLSKEHASRFGDSPSWQIKE